MMFSKLSKHVITRSHLIKSIRCSPTVCQKELQNGEKIFIDNNVQFSTSLNIQMDQPQTRRLNQIEEKSIFLQPKMDYTEKVTKLLQHKFNLSTFSPSQLEAITSILNNQDCLLIKSTGGGKSLCYQIPALIKDGFCIVISPLISLIDDQVNYLKGINVPAISINSNTPREVTEKFVADLNSGKIGYKIVFLTPEKLRLSRKLKSVLYKVGEKGLISFITIDEVHCIKAWGESFRPTYLLLNNLRKHIKCPVLGLTATASNEYIDFIVDSLKLKKPLILKSSVQRNNLKYEVVVKNSIKKKGYKQVVEMIKNRFNNKCGIIYCLTKNECESLCKELTSSNIKATFFHSQIPKSEKINRLLQWLNGDIDIMVGTSAFGMGINKEDVNFIIHYSMPYNLLSYVQETGRAGRNGEDATCVLMFNIYDVARILKISSNEDKLEKINEMLKFIYVNKCKRKMIGDCFDEEFNEEECKKNCKDCSNSLETQLNMSNEEKEKVFQFIKKMLTHKKENNVTQKLLFNYLKKNFYPILSDEKLNLIVTKLIIDNKIQFVNKKTFGISNNYIVLK